MALKNVVCPLFYILLSYFEEIRFFKKSDFYTFIKLATEVFVLPRPTLSYHPFG